MTTDDRGAVIAVIRRLPNVHVDALFDTLVKRWRHTIRIAGVVAESYGLADRACDAGFLRNLATGERFSMFQELGSASESCHLNPDGVLAATAALQRDIADGCDFAVLSKFGKLEAAGGGLIDAFSAAVEAGIPVLTSVSRAFEPALTQYAAPMFCWVRADIGEIEEWMNARIRGKSAWTQ
jgi:Protein of unknown function (DUF2478)